MPLPRGKSWLFGNTTRRGKQSVPLVTAPGALVAVNQVISAATGFAGQMRGFLTNELSYVHLQLSTTTADHILKAKRSFKRFAKGCHPNVYQHTTCQAWAHTIRPTLVFQRTSPPTWTHRATYTDNHIFNGKQFLDQVHSAKHIMSHCAIKA
jgi:uncharacterized protein with PIN domain